MKLTNVTLTIDREKQIITIEPNYKLMPKEEWDYILNGILKIFEWKNASIIYHGET